MSRSLLITMYARALKLISFQYCYSNFSCFFLFVQIKLNLIEFHLLWEMTFEELINDNGGGEGNKQLLR